MFSFCFLYNQSDADLSFSCMLRYVQISHNRGNISKITTNLPLKYVRFYGTYISIFTRLKFNYMNSLTNPSFAVINFNNLTHSSSLSLSLVLIMHNLNFHYSPKITTNISFQISNNIRFNSHFLSLFDYNLSVCTNAYKLYHFSLKIQFDIEFN